MRRARLLALFLDVLVCAGLADLAGLVFSVLAWRLYPPGRAAVPGLWAALGLCAVAGFLVRDARGGRARRWLALEARREDGRSPGAWGSIRRNVPLLIPVWNLFDAWPVLRDGTAPRRCDRASGTRILQGT